MFLPRHAAPSPDRKTNADEYSTRYGTTSYSYDAPAATIPTSIASDGFTFGTFSGVDDVKTGSVTETGMNAEGTGNAAGSNIAPVGRMAAAMVGFVALL